MDWYAFWDFDSKDDFEKVKDSTLNLLEKLYELKLLDGVKVYFSGNKGIHVILHTNNKFNPQEASKICYSLAMDAGVDMSVFDSVVYNVNRIFRVEDTKHPESGLYKQELNIDILKEQIVTGKHRHIYSSIHS